MRIVESPRVSGNLSVTLRTKQKGRTHVGSALWLSMCIAASPKRSLKRESERCDSLRKARYLARNGVLMKNAASNTTSHFRLCRLQCFSCCCLVASFASCFDLFHETADAADARTVDLCAAVVATDALLCLRRIGHNFVLSRVL